MVSASELYQPGGVVTMVRPSIATNNDLPNVPGQADSLTTSTSHPVSAGTRSSAPAHRGVLDGAFAILDALAHVEDGLGLTALSRASGLAKSSAYRLAEQLVAVGAVQNANHRYYIGARIGRIGQRWQPDPILRQAAQAPVHTLAIQSGAIAMLRILHDDRLRIICATVPRGHAYIPNPADPESTARTATGRVLYAAGTANTDALPACWTAHEWRQLRDSVRDLHATVADRQEAFPGICCVSTPVWWPEGTCAGAVTALLQAAKPATNLRDLVLCAARSIGAGLARPSPRPAAVPPRLAID